MKKSLITYIVAVCGLVLVNAQVGIGTNTPHSSKILDLKMPNKGFRGPSVTLTALNSPAPITSPADGLMVYNTYNNGGDLTKGYYVWKAAENKWVLLGEAVLSTVIDSRVGNDLLGYKHDPNTDITSTQVTNPGFIGGRPITFLGCTPSPHYTFPDGTLHKYCAYNIAAPGITWQDAFSAAKKMNGYLATITTKEEWDYLFSNLIEGGIIMPNDIWIGYNKVRLPGPDTSIYTDSDFQFLWATGEVSRINWTNASSVFSNFFGTEPNNSGNKEGCTHVWRKAIYTTRRWNDASCDAFVTSNMPVSFIVEFGTYPNEKN